MWNTEKAGQQHENWCTLTHFKEEKEGKRNENAYQVTYSKNEKLGYGWIRFTYMGLALVF